MSSNTLDNSPTLSYPVDAEHGGIRLSVVLVFVVTWIVTYLLLNVLIASEGLNIIAMFGSFVVTAIITQQLERLLRSRWPSGRRVDITPEHIRIMKGNQLQESIDADKQVNVLLWRFKIKRRSRVPKGWFMVACALEQDDIYLPVYTFLSPEDNEKLKVPTHFTLLTSAKESGEAKTDLRLAGVQRRLHTAESARWMSGAEMNQDDFVNYVKQLQEHYPQWMPSVL